MSDRELCSRCGEPLEDPAYKLCEKCRLYLTNENKPPSRNERNRFCIECGARIRKGLQTGHYCYRCYKKQRRQQPMKGMEYDADKAAQAQVEYCDRNELHCYAPRDGYCWHCNENIYKLISVEDAGKTLITSCPYCHSTFVD